MRKRIRRWFATKKRNTQQNKKTENVSLCDLFDRVEILKKSDDEAQSIIQDLRNRNEYLHYCLDEMQEKQNVLQQELCDAQQELCDAQQQTQYIQSCGNYIPCRLTLDTLVAECGWMDLQNNRVLVRTKEGEWMTAPLQNQPLTFDTIQKCPYTTKEFDEWIKSSSKENDSYPDGKHPINCNPIKKTDWVYVNNIGKLLQSLLQEKETLTTRLQASYQTISQMKQKPKKKKSHKQRCSTPNYSRGCLQECSNDNSICEACHTERGLD